MYPPINCNKDTLSNLWSQIASNKQEQTRQTRLLISCTKC